MQDKTLNFIPHVLKTKKNVNSLLGKLRKNSRVLLSSIVDIVFLFYLLHDIMTN